MSPLDHAEKCIIYEKTRVSDGMGGFVVEWNEGIEFDALISLDSSVEARLAEQSGVVDNYTVYVDKAFPISAGEYFKRASNDTTFRVTSSPDEQQTPAISGMNYKVFTAQKTVLPTL